MPSRVTITNVGINLVSGYVNADGKTYTFERRHNHLTLYRPTRAGSARMQPLAGKHAREWRELVERKLAEAVDRLSETSARRPPLDLARLA